MPEKPAAFKREPPQHEITTREPRRPGSEPERRRTPSSCPPNHRKPTRSNTKTHRSEHSKISLLPRKRQGSPDREQRQ
ncbi:hypothetical protein F2Q68_00004130 [Brassica cretica]|uniref:Uncharacterized protein n=2 Tax=Brassica cretica TaxID=69181 RepID=A0ABQ7C169_BRACR|nr:hypothetical protein F2Q68_00004130 [Brassica cretica]KAF3544937.1 hypothetical protein DY000_02006018 [Brassica cretica]